MLEPAAAADADGVVALRDAVARWMVAGGIAQWTPGEVTVRVVQDQIAMGQWFVHRVDGAVRAALRLLEADDEVWGSQPTDALYVHGLVADLSLRGTGLGAQLLRWAEARVADSGRRYLRLDCVETNQRLRQYYREQGFREAGRSDRDGGRHPVTLMEKVPEGPHAKNPGGR